MELEILKWFLLVNLAFGALLRVAMIGWEPPRWTNGGAISSLIINGALAAWILHAIH